MAVKRQLSMVMDLNNCIGCHTCTSVCKLQWANRNGREYMYWNNVETMPGTGYPKNYADMGEGDYPNSYYFYLPRLGNHCENPACLAACSRNAIYKRQEDGIVLIDQERCRGYRYCVGACPYKKVYFNEEISKSEKCVFCYPQIEKGKDPSPSRRAQRDFIRRYLGAMLQSVADRLKAGPPPGLDPAIIRSRSSVRRCRSLLHYGRGTMASETA